MIDQAATLAAVTKIKNEAEKKICRSLPCQWPPFHGQSWWVEPHLPSAALRLSTAWSSVVWAGIGLSWSSSCCNGTVNYRRRNKHGWRVQSRKQCQVTIWKLFAIQTGRPTWLKLCCRSPTVSVPDFYRQKKVWQGKASSQTKASMLSNCSQEESVTERW